MTTGARIGVLVAVIVLAAAGFVIASGSNDDETTAQTTTETAASETETTKTETGTEATETERTPVRPRPTRIVVSGGQPRGGVKRIRVKSGERVQLVVQSDVADHVHVHGYDIMRDVAPGQNARFNFKADIEGSFEIELEDRALEIAALTVTP